MPIALSRQLWGWLLYAVVLALTAATLLYENDIATGNGDILGPLAFPRYTAGLLLCLLLMKIVSARKAGSASARSNEQTPNSEHMKILGMLLLILGFIALVSLQWVPFWLCIALFLIASISFLNPPRGWRSLLPVTLFAVTFALAVSYIVQTLFYFSL